MFTLFPKHQQDWRRVLVFPFYMFPFIAIVAYWVAAALWHPLPPSPYSRHPDFTLNFFAGDLASSCATDFICLLGIGIIQLMRGHRSRAGLSFGIAGFAFLVSLFLLSRANFVST